MSRGVFVTGTDTGVGKTLVTAGIVRWLRNQGIDAVPMKPVQTGAEPCGGRLVASDLEFCFSVSGFRPGYNEVKLMAPYVYGPSCSPHLAGRMARHYPEPLRIKNCADRLLEKHQAVIIEGAGGTMAPLNESQTMLDLMKVLEYPVVLVSKFGLGTINHTLLSIHALRTAGIDLIGVVFNHVEPTRAENQYIEEDNPKIIAQFGNVRVLGKIRFLDNLNSMTQGTWKQFEHDMTGFPHILDRLDGSKVHG